MNNMNLREFTDYMKNNILKSLDESYKNASVEIKDVEKLNCRYTSLQVRREGETIVPSIDLNKAFARYIDGDSLTTIITDIAAAIDMERPDFDVDIINNYEEIKGKLSVRLSNVEKNNTMFDTIPHVKILDMGITYHIVLSPQSSITVSNALLEHLGIEAKQLHNDAVKNSIEKNPLTVMSMEDALRETFRKDLVSMGMPEDEIESRLDVTFPRGKGSGLIVISNTDRVNGASVLAYPETLDKVAERLNESFYLLPSSIHELLAVPESSGMTSIHLDEMVTEINSSQVLPEERLTDHCYHYDAKAKLFEYGKEFEDRVNTAVAV